MSGVLPLTVLPPLYELLVLGRALPVPGLCWSGGPPFLGVL